MIAQLDAHIVKLEASLAGMSDLRAKLRRWDLFAPYVEGVAKGEIPAAFYSPPAEHGTVVVAIIPRTEHDPLRAERLAELEEATRAFVDRVETRKTGFYTNVQRDDLYQRIKALVLP